MQKHHSAQRYLLVQSLACFDTDRCYGRCVQILDPADREKLPKLSAWYQVCYENCAAIREVWKGGLLLAEVTATEAGKPKESKDDKKAREKARKKEKEATKKAEKAAQPGKEATDGGVINVEANDVLVISLTVLATPTITSIEFESIQPHENVAKGNHCDREVQNACVARTALNGHHGEFSCGS
jgi:hypothetical protein